MVSQNSTLPTVHSRSSEKMQLSIQGSSPTFDIGDLPFETVAAIQDRVLFVQDGDFFFRNGDAIFDEIRPAIRDGVLFVQDNFAISDRNQDFFIRD